MGRAPPPPSFGQNPKEQQHFFRRTSLRTHAASLNYIDCHLPLTMYLHFDKVGKSKLSEGKKDKNKAADDVDVQGGPIGDLQEQIVNNLQFFI